MNDHISYAMRNSEALESFFSFNSPASLLDWSHFAIELIFLVGFGLTVLHAIRFTRRNRDFTALMILAGAFFYGLVMDIISYYTVESFWHGEFTVMLVYNRLPLYIVLLYPALIYHLIMTVRRYEFPPVLEAAAVGFFGGLLYLVFDNFGPQVGWWIWDLNDSSNLPFVSSVPLTSYGWYFLYTGAFAWLSRYFSRERGFIKGTTGKALVSLIILPLGTILLGTILFTPYSILARNVPPWNLMDYQPSLGWASAIHLIAFTTAGLAFVLKYHRPRMPRDELLMMFPLIYLAGMSYLYIAKYHVFLGASADGLTHEGLAVGNLVAGILAIVAGTAIVLVSHSEPERHKNGL